MHMGLFFKKHFNKGFTLIELSIVLVIIGLVIGGVLVGRDLLELASIRSQITQFEQYATAVNTFKLKYNGLPGDFAEVKAAAFGFSTGRDAGIIGPGYQNNNDDSVTTLYWYSYNSITGEVLYFWEDLSKAQLIPGTYGPVVSDYNATANLTDQQISKYLPKAKIGPGNLYILVYTDIASGRAGRPCFSKFCFAIYPITATNALAQYNPSMTTVLTVSQVSAIDIKIDDGTPLKGKLWGGTSGAWGSMVDNAAAAPCTSGTPVTYNLSSNAFNCILNLGYGN